MTFTTQLQTIITNQVTAEKQQHYLNLLESLIKDYDASKTAQTVSTTFEDLIEYEESGLTTGKATLIHLLDLYEQVIDTNRKIVSFQLFSEVPYFLIGNPSENKFIQVLFENFVTVNDGNKFITVDRTEVAYSLTLYAISLYSDNLEDLNSKGILSDLPEEALQTMIEMDTIIDGSHLKSTILSAVISSLFNNENMPTHFKMVSNDDQKVIMEVSFEESDINSEQSLIMDNHGESLSNIDVLDTEIDAVLIYNDEHIDTLIDNVQVLLEDDTTIVFMV